MSRGVKIIVAVVVLVVVAAGAGIWWYLRDDAPAEVSLSTAAESVTEGTDASGRAATLDSVDGTWVVDTETGEFDYESATGTFAGFRVAEELASIGSTTAVGRTGDVSGSATIAGGSLTAATFEIDLTTITTNESRRDDKVQEALDTGQFPTATFTLTEPVALPADAASGDPISVTAKGDFTVHGVTRPVEVALEARVVGTTVVVVGSFDISFADYGVEAPRAPIVLSVADDGVVELQLLLVQQGA